VHGRKTASHYAEVAMSNPFFNPFTETQNDSTDEDLVAQAQAGSRDAIEKLILRHQAWIYNIAVRMVFQPADAEEVTQEVLIKAITHLSTFRRQSRFRTWLYRITANHVLNMQRRGGESAIQTFASYGDAINGTPDGDLPDASAVPVDVPLLVEEAKVACTTGMLLCLDRRQRLVFMLGEIFGVSDTLGGEILDISSDNFRQLLSRARHDLYQFMTSQCGLVRPENPCRCAKKTRGFIADGHVDPHRLQFASLHVRRVEEAAPESVRTLDDAFGRQYPQVFREHAFHQSPDPAKWFRELLDRPEFRAALRLS
jgi:RNA polymerase sigma factor (sigma-70 family)